MADPGYGDAQAPVGSAEWAKRWRLCFQTVVKNLPKSPQSSLEYLELGERHKAWSLLTDRRGRSYCDFDSFCRDELPWGLGMDPRKFRAYLAAEKGQKAADLETVAPAQQGERTDLGEETSRHDDGKLPARKQERLRAILRAPAVVQELYKEGRINQADAARLGPKSPTPEKAARIAEARRGIEQIDRGLTPRAFRKEAKAVVTRALELPTASSLDLLRRAWKKASFAERQAFLAEVT